MTILILGLVLFLGIHSVRIVAPQWRDERIKGMGEGPWKGIYSVVSIIGLGLIIWGYGIARETTEFWYVLPNWTGHVTLLLMAASFVFLAVSQMPAGKIKPAVKHPMLLAVKLWAFSHLLVNGDTASIVLFGSFLVWAIVDRISVKRRNTELPEAGPPENDLKAAAAGLILYALFIWQLHYWLFGVVPLV